MLVTGKADSVATTIVNTLRRRGTGMLMYGSMTALQFIPGYVTYIAARYCWRGRNISGWVDVDGLWCVGHLFRNGSSSLNCGRLFFICLNTGMWRLGLWCAFGTTRMRKMQMAKRKEVGNIWCVNFIWKFWITLLCWLTICCGSYWMPISRNLKHPLRAPGLRKHFQCTQLLWTARPPRPSAIAWLGPLPLVDSVWGGASWCLIWWFRGFAVFVLCSCVLWNVPNCIDIFIPLDFQNQFVYLKSFIRISGYANGGHCSRKMKKKCW